MQGPKRSLNATSVNLGVLHYWRQNNITIGTVTAQNETEYAQSQDWAKLHVNSQQSDLLNDSLISVSFFCQIKTPQTGKGTECSLRKVKLMQEMLQHHVSMYCVDLHGRHTT